MYGVCSLSGTYCWSLSVSDSYSMHCCGDVMFVQSCLVSRWSHDGEVGTTVVMLRDETWFYLSGYVNCHNSRC
jgi:hypothetical protein